MKVPNAFRTIGEVALALNIETHVLRFWETKFAQISPIKDSKGRRLYRADDMKVLQKIQYLLHEQGMTIKGVQKLIRDNGKSILFKTEDMNIVDSVEPKTQFLENSQKHLKDLRQDLLEMQAILES